MSANNTQGRGGRGNRDLEEEDLMEVTITTTKTMKIRTKMKRTRLKFLMKLQRN